MSCPSSPTEIVARYVALRNGPGEAFPDPEKPGLWVSLGGLPVYMPPERLEAFAADLVARGVCDEEGNPIPRPHRRERPKTARPLLLARLPWPPSVNRLWRANRGRVHLSREARAWKERAQWALRLRWGQEPLVTPVQVHLLLAPPDNRRRDLDNLAKSVLDALNGVVIGDDSQVRRLILDRSAPQPPGHVLVRVFPYRRPW